MDNKISFQLTDEENTKITEAIQTLVSVLEPKLVSLSADDKKELPKMGDKTAAFVNKSLEYGSLYPSYIPDFIDVNEAKVDIESVNALRQIFLPLERITNRVDDTITLAGSEAYSSALSIYKALKNAAGMGQPGADEATAELKNRFPGKKKSLNEQLG